MVKKFKNGKTMSSFAKFKEFDETKPVYDIYPIWVNEVNQKVIIDDNDYNYFEELFIDLP